MATTNAIAFRTAPERAESGSPARPPLNLVHTDPMVAAYRKHLPLPADSCPILNAAVRYLLSAPGSLIRMRVAYPMAVSFGMLPQAALCAATAIEYFHTASLVLDDLPCMDDAGQRRGAPCVHRVYGEHEAILAALALINRAYSLAWKAMAECPAPRAQSAMEYLEQMLGLGGLLSGQSRDIGFSSQSSIGTATCVAREKTVSLIRLSLVWPALLAGAGPRELQLLERVALFWGLAYQASDDLKDVLASSAETGKTSSRDALLRRPNLALELGAFPAFARLERLLRLGDGFFRMLLGRHPSLGFLDQLRSGLDRDVVALREQVESSAPGAPA